MINEFVMVFECGFVFYWFIGEVNNIKLVFERF